MKCPQYFLALFIFFSVFLSHGSEEAKAVAPTHADAAIIVAKYSGLFDRYVEKDATLSECVSFLNERGIYFSLLEVVNGKEFSEMDCARVLGQVDLLLSGEAEFSHGKVKLPKEIDSWKEFCIMNGVQYVEGYRSMMDGAKHLSRIHD